ncbi:MAG: hypothetical protein ACI3V2_07490 [Faecousia sp.]
MNNMIDLVPYLPREAVMPKKRRRRHFGSIAAFIESVVTLCIGVGFFLFLAAFFSVI